MVIVLNCLNNTCKNMYFYRSFCINVHNVDMKKQSAPLNCRYMANKGIFLLILTLICTSPGCKNNPLDVNISGINLEVKIQRFEKELFTMNPDSLEESIPVLYQKYDDFFDVFSYHVINIGMPSDTYYPGYLSMFVTDRMNRTVYNETIQLFPGLEGLETTFSSAFKRYTYHFPEKKIPELVSYISGFNHSHFTVGNYVGIGLDKYLGTENEFYERMEFPRYQRLNMFGDKIPSDVLFALASAEITYNDSMDNLLGRIIHLGKLMYFVDALLPDQPDSLKIGFTIAQMNWCKNNEKQMWEYLIENKLLFSSDPMTIRKITEPAPFTSYFTSESPGRAGVWIGWQIVREYARRNKDLSVSEIIQETDYQSILKHSRYNP
jgi:hypothetical protein